MRALPVFDDTMIVTLGVQDLQEIALAAVAEALWGSGHHDLLDLKHGAGRYRVGREAIAVARGRRRDGGRHFVEHLTYRSTPSATLSRRGNSWYSVRIAPAS